MWDCPGEHLLSYPLEIRQVLMLRPVLSGGAAHQVEDLVDLLHLAFARQQGGIQDELPHNAAHAPHVDGCRVLLHTYTDRQTDN